MPNRPTPAVASNPSTMRVLVAGCGFVGAALAGRLAARGVRVFGGKRNPVGLPAGVTPWALDLAAPVVPDGVTHVVFCAAPDEGSEEAYRRLYVDGLTRLLDALDQSRAPLERLVYTSSTSVFAEASGGDVDETSAVTSQPHGAIVREAEVITQARPGGVVIRLAGIYGPGRERMIRMVASGEARCSHPAPIGNRIHRDDAAGAIDHLLTLAQPDDLYVGVDDAPVELCEVYRWLAARLGVAPPAESSEPDARGRGAFKRCRNGRLRASGYELAYPTYREGYGAMLDGQT